MNFLLWKRWIKMYEHVATGLQEYVYLVRAIVKSILL